MNRFEISYELNGKSGSAFFVAETGDEAMAKFREWADDETASGWISGCWAIES